MYFWHKYLRILDMLVRFTPMLWVLSQRNLLEPSALRLTDTSDTVELSIACGEVLETRGNI